MYLMRPPRASMHTYNTASPQAIPSGRVGQIAPGQDPDFDKQHADTHRGMWWPHKELILIAGQCVCVIGMSKL